MLTLTLEYVHIRLSKQHAENYSEWYLGRKDDVHDLQLPSDEALAGMYKEIFPNTGPLHIEPNRQRWGCVLAMPKGLRKRDRDRFVERVETHLDTRPH